MEKNTLDTTAETSFSIDYSVIMCPDSRVSLKGSAKVRAPSSGDFIDASSSESGAVERKTNDTRPCGFDRG